MQPRGIFTVRPITYPSGEKAWQVSGTNLDGKRIRKTYSSKEAAHDERALLASDYAKDESARVARPTSLPEMVLRQAEILHAEMHRRNLVKVDWLEFFRPHLEHAHRQPSESPLIGKAAVDYSKWLEGESGLRDDSQKNYRLRVDKFAESAGNEQVSAITQDYIDNYLDGRDVAAETKDNDKRALNHFFNWCMERNRRWSVVNPCTGVKKRARRSDEQPEILTLAESQKLMQEAEAYKGGKLALYCALCLFGKLRPFEVRRLRPEQINLTDGEIRLEASQTKTGKARTISITPEIRTNKGVKKGPNTLFQWLKKYKGRPIFPPNWRKDFDVLKERIGYSGRKDGDERAGLKEWPEDVLRHTGISHQLRLTGSYGDTARESGNSEQVLKNHYEGRVSTAETKRFYAIRPSKAKRLALPSVAHPQALLAAPDAVEEATSSGK